MAPLHLIDPIALQLGPISIHWYGVMYLLAFAGAWWLGRRRLRQGRLPVTEAAFADLAFYVMLGVVLGGRLGYVLFYGFDALRQDPFMIVRVWEGGMSFHGGMLGVLAAIWIWSRRQHVHVFDTIDFIAPLIPIGLGLGRLGNFIGGELWGRVSNVPWAMVFPKSLPFDASPEQLAVMNAAGELDAYTRHPSQLYEFGLEGLVLFAVLWIFSATPRRRYAVSGLFGLLYGIFRTSVEFFRQPDGHIGFVAADWLTMGMLLSMPMIVIGIVLLWMSRRAPILLPAAREIEVDEPGEVAAQPTPRRKPSR